MRRRGPGYRPALKDLLRLDDRLDLLGAELLPGLEVRSILRAGRLKVREVLRVGVPDGGGVREVCFVAFGVSILYGTSTPSPGMANLCLGHYVSTARARVSWRGLAPSRRSPEDAGKCRVRSYGRSPSPCSTSLPWICP